MYGAVLAVSFPRHAAGDAAADASTATPGGAQGSGAGDRDDADGAGGVGESKGHGGMVQTQDDGATRHPAGWLQARAGVGPDAGGGGAAAAVSMAASCGDGHVDLGATTTLVSREELRSEGQQTCVVR